MHENMAIMTFQHIKLSFIQFIQRQMLEAYPLGNQRSLIHFHTALTLSLSTVYAAFGLKILPFTCFRCNSGLLQNFLKSSLPLIVSFVFPLSSITVLNRLSKIFLSICITSKLCRISKVLQYGNTQKILLFFQL